jgi:hypothetical protein
MIKRRDFISLLGGADARRMVALAQDYGWLPPYISIYRRD